MEAPRRPVTAQALGMLFRESTSCLDSIEPHWAKCHDKCHELQMDSWPQPACPLLSTEERLKRFQCYRRLSCTQSQVTAKGQLDKHDLQDREYDTVLGQLSVTSFVPEAPPLHLVMSCML